MATFEQSEDSKQTTEHVEGEPPAPQALEQHANEPANEPANPAVALLKSMFPDFDDLVLQTVLESVSGDQDAAIDVLLGMSDPSYVSTHTPRETHPERQPSLDVDEALARQLQLEDDRAHAESQQRTRGTNWPQRRNSESQQGQAQPQQGSSGGPDLTEIKETLNQMAESGKRTFSSIVSRAKAKIGEYQQSRQNTQQQQQQHPPPSWGSTSAQAQTSPNPASFPNYYHEAPTQPVDRHTASQAYAQYYADGSPDLGQGDGDGWQQISRRGRRSEEKPLAEQPKPGEIKGYDLDAHSESTSATAPTTTSTFAPPSGALSELGPTIPNVTTSPSNIPRPPATQSGSPLNAAKFGLLPKRPVSLLTPQPSGANAVAREPSASEDDEDELDYVENPFEEHKH